MLAKGGSGDDASLRASDGRERPEGAAES
jgi:hypothetical protein